ncbi:hypothetical protein [Nocardioides sp. Soil805]|uniref:hypothetical protein n=1 Tax=Nocardioides sp. Soil805 TaxID=1736416 RepID=UPI000B245B87|nr:hypothetical protein [Nocardioides sp. Soil805]
MRLRRRFATLRRGVLLLPALLPVLILVPLLTAPPALADSARLRDATGDMFTVEEGATTGVAAPDARIGDMVRVRFRHTRDRVVVRARFVELRPVGRRFTLWVDMRAPGGRRTTLGVQARRDDRQGHVILMDAHGGDLTCTVRHRIDYSRDVVTAVVPRSCLGDPASLRFSVLSEQWGRRLHFANLDDGHTATAPGPLHWTGPVRAG